MGPIRLGIQIDGRRCWTLFDSGARNTYVVVDAAGGLPRRVIFQVCMRGVVV
ncbi:MAG: hypothetical protein HYT87_09285 [Nitrospirae bacterium]|nr:hypothetical protein [Nitrospirota bacterium]